MNRAQRRALARKNGWKGNKSKRGISLLQALARAEELKEERERAESIAKIQEAARATRDMGLVIPGQ